MAAPFSYAVAYFSRVAERALDGKARLAKGLLFQFKETYLLISADDPTCMADASVLFIGD